MANTNCLEGLRCPQCKQENRLKIIARIMCMVTDDGSDPFGDHDWDDDSIADCPECGFMGPLGRFRYKPDLPPYPEGMNDRRAGWAERAVAAFIDATGTDRGDALPDLLGDLMHWCDRNDIDFVLALNRARWHYRAETTGEGL